MTDEGKFLDHYGVKGMHWGVRRADIAEVDKLVSKTSSGLKVDTTKSTFSKQVKEAGGLHSVSEKDLKAMLNRMEMEKKFSTFMKEDSARRKAGAEAAFNLLLKVGKIAVPVLIGAVAAKKAAPTVFRTFSEFQKSLGR